MAIFPALKPQTRTFTPGEYPHTPFSSYSKAQNRVRHSNVVLASQIRLGFVALTEAQMLSILTHYRVQYGGYESFAVADEVWSGVTIISDYQLSGYLWRYLSPPVVTDLLNGRFDVSIELETAPPDGAIVDGTLYQIELGLAPGVGCAASGLNRIVVISIVSTGFGIGGIEASIASSLVAASAAAANGMAAAITATLSSGAATTANGASFTVTITFEGGIATSTSPPPAPLDTLASMIEDDLLELLF